MYIYKFTFIITPRNINEAEMIGEGFIAGTDIEDARKALVSQIPHQWAGHAEIHSLVIEYWLPAPQLELYLTARLPWKGELVGDSKSIWEPA